MVHDVWSTMFNQCYKTVFLSINFKIKGWRAPCYHSLGETLIIRIRWEPVSNTKHSFKKYSKLSIQIIIIIIIGNGGENSYC